GRVCICVELRLTEYYSSARHRKLDKSRPDSFQETAASNQSVHRARKKTLLQQHQFNLRQILAFLLHDYPSPFALNHLFFISVRVINNARSEVRNEEGCGVINPCCSVVACCCGHGRGAAGGKNLPYRVPRSKQCFWYGGPLGGVPARAEQAWMDRGKEYHHQVPVWREQRP